MKVYICSPYRGDTEINIERAQRFCKMAVQRGHIPIAPHLYFTQFLDENNCKERELGMCYANALLKACDEIWVCGNKISEGMSREIELAKKN